MGGSDARRIISDTVYEVLVGAVLEVLGTVRELTCCRVFEEFFRCRRKSVGGVIRLKKDERAGRRRTCADTHHVSADVVPTYSLTDSSLVQYMIPFVRVERKWF